MPCSIIDQSLVACLFSLKAIDTRCLIYQSALFESGLQITLASLQVNFSQFDKIVLAGSTLERVVWGPMCKWGSRFCGHQQLAPTV